MRKKLIGTFVLGTFLATLTVACGGRRVTVYNTPPAPSQIIVTSPPAVVAAPPAVTVVPPSAVRQTGYYDSSGYWHATGWYDSGGYWHAF